MFVSIEALRPGDLITFEAARVFISPEDARHDYGRADRTFSNEPPKVAVFLGTVQQIRLIRDLARSILLARWGTHYIYRDANPGEDVQPYTHQMIVFCEGKNLWISLDKHDGGDRLRIKKLT